MFHSFQVPSSRGETGLRASGETASARTHSVCARQTWIGSWLDTSHSRT